LETWVPGRRFETSLAFRISKRSFDFAQDDKISGV
jgi:hypothetical protein